MNKLRSGFKINDNLREIAVCLLLSFIFISMSWSVARASPSGSIDASVNLSETGAVDLHIVWREKAPENLKINEASWSMTLSSPKSGKLEADLTVSVTFSEEGLQWLSKEGLKDKLSLASPNLVEGLIMDDWEGKKISNIEWAGILLRVMPEEIGGQILKLTIEEIDCDKFEWKEPILNIGLGENLTGDIVNNQGSVDDPPVNMSGTLEVSKRNWTRTVDAHFQVDSSEEWSWSFSVPHLQSIFGPAEHGDLKQSFSSRGAELTVNTIKDADMSNVPGGYEKTGLTYTWTDREAADGTAALLTGEGGYSISYPETQPTQLDAVAGGPYTVNEGGTVGLDGTGSYDPDGGIASYSWSIADDPTGEASLTGADTATPVFHAPSVDSDTKITVQLTVRNNAGDTNADSASITVHALPGGPTLKNLENILPGKAVELLTGSSLGDAVSAIERLPSEAIASILEASVENGLTDNIVKILNVMSPSKAASARHACGPSISVRITGAMVEENMQRAAKVVDRGARLNLEKEAEIISRLSTDKAADLLLAIFKLPETPEIAADLLGAMSTEDSTEIVRTLIDMKKFEQLDTMFSHLHDQRLNDIYRELTEKERGSLYHALSSEARSKITAPLAPCFETENLRISEVELTPGGVTSIFITVANEGGTPGASIVKLVINEMVEDNQKIYLNAGETETVSFEVGKEKTGNYTVQVGGQTGSFQVVEKGNSIMEYLKKHRTPVTAFAIVLTAVIILYWHRSDKKADENKFNSRVRGPRPQMSDFKKHL